MSGKQARTLPSGPEWDQWIAGAHRAVTSTEIAQLRALHIPEEGYANEEGGTFFFCSFCMEHGMDNWYWPCSVVCLIEEVERKRSQALR